MPISFRWKNAHPLQSGQHGCAFHWAAVVSMQDDLTRLDVVPEASLFYQGGCMTGQLLVVHFPTADLAAIDVQEHVQAQELATHSDRKIGDVAGPGLIGPGGGKDRKSVV